MDGSIIRMANDIARFHESYPEDEGMQMLSEHLNKFWHASMRTRFHELMAAQPESFHPLVVASAGMVRCAKTNPVSTAGMDLTGTGG